MDVVLRLMASERYLLSRINDLQTQLDQQDRLIDALLIRHMRLQEKIGEYTDLIDYLTPWMDAVERELVKHMSPRPYEPYLLGRRENPLTRQLEGRPIDKRRTT